MNAGDAYGVVEAQYIWRHHRHQPKENQCTSALVKHIKAPVHLVSFCSFGIYLSIKWFFCTIFVFFFFKTFGQRRREDFDRDLFIIIIIFLCQSDESRSISVDFTSFLLILSSHLHFSAFFVLFFRVWFVFILFYFIFCVSCDYWATSFWIYQSSSFIDSS